MLDVSFSTSVCSRLPKLICNNCLPLLNRSAKDFFVVEKNKDLVLQRRNILVAHGGFSLTKKKYTRGSWRILMPVVSLNIGRWVVPINRLLKSSSLKRPTFAMKFQPSA